MTIHQQVRIQHGDLEADVDEGLAALILAIWKCGIWTLNSCQENKPGVAWIEFSGTDEAKEFLDIVARKFPARAPKAWETLYGRVMGFGESDWEYDVHPEDFNVRETIVDDEVISECIGPAYVEFTVSIRFPVSDIPRIQRRLDQYLATNQRRAKLGAP